MIHNYVSDLEKSEAAVMAKFCNNKVLQKLPHLDNFTFKNLLLQKRLFSLDFFERFYNTAICGLEDEEAKNIGRSLIQEEYPIGGPTHREDTVYDLMQIGIPKREILTTLVSETTQETIDAIINLVRYDGTPNYDTRAVTALRFGGEVLAGVEMGVLCNELERRHGLTRADSHFYWPHAGHDQKTVALGEAGTSHSDRFGKVLLRLVSTAEDSALAKEVMEQAYSARSLFYNQFA